MHLGSIQPDGVQIEIYADPVDSGMPLRAPMALDHTAQDSPGVYEFSGAVPSDRPVQHYTPRAIPRRQGVSIPLELSLITWQK